MTRTDRGPEYLSKEEAEQVLQFLSEAPPAVQPWAERQAATLAAALAAATTPTDDARVAGESVPAAVPADDLEESEDFYNDLDEDDDILVRRKKTRPAAATTPVSAASQRGGAGAASKKRFSSGAKWGLAAVLIAGVAVGVWWAGRPGPVETAMPEMPENHPGTISTSDSAEKIAALEAVLAEDPDNVDAHLELGVVYFDLTNVARAKEQWLHVTELDPDNVSAWYNLGFAYLSESPPDLESTAAAWEKVIELDPGSALAETAQAHLDSLETMAVADTGTGD